MTTPLMQIMKFFDRDKVVPFLQDKQLIPSQRDCVCGHQMNLQKYARCLDGWIFRCTKCKKTRSIRTGRFFENEVTPLSTMLQLMFLWLINVPVTTASELVDVTRKTGIQWFNYFRDICAFKMTNLNEKLGGVSVIVQVDESLMFRRKNNVGRIVQQFWIFGMYDTSLKKGYLVYVQDRSASTLLPIIQRWVHVGTIIYSDCWRAYDGLTALGYIHMRINHSTNFVDPNTGATTNHIEAFWSRIKRQLKYISGSQGAMKWNHLEEACYRHWYGFKCSEVRNNINVYLTHLKEFNDSQ
jgi:transposase